MQLTENTLLADRYRVSHLLGQGGMGAVYLAVDLRFRDSPVAVKQTLVGMHREDLRRAFEREAMLLNHLRHPALPKVTDFFMQGDSEFLVMEYVPGEDLGTELVRRGMPFPVECVALWADRLLDAVSYLHSRTPPVIHRDIKPQNVRLTLEGEIVLLDFGLSKGSVGVHATVGSSVVAGTPNYAPPEQLGGRGTDERSDLYSLAATIYCLLTTAPPADANRRLMCHVNGEGDPARPAHLLNPAIPLAVSGVLERALSLRVDGRPKSAVTMREELRAGFGDVVSGFPPVMQYGSAESASRKQSSRSDLSKPWLPSEQHDRTLASTAVEAQGPHALRTEIQPADRRMPPAKVSMPRPNVARVGGAPGWVVTVYVLLIVAAFVGAVALLFASRTVREGSRELVQAALIETKSFDISGGHSIEMVRIGPGTFTMGSQKGDGFERPMREVTISKAFYLGRYEVTQEQWAAMMITNPAKHIGPGLPVEDVSILDVEEFLKVLNARTGGGWRLPTEAEWEYACRAGTDGDHAGKLDDLGWYDANSGGASHPVGKKRPNAWGLYDMHGNVWEWCQDWLLDYPRVDETDPVADAASPFRVRRGGGFSNGAHYCRSAFRAGNLVNEKFPFVGLRLARSA
ncbi:MAG: SUMF1/EgtB/PvdO family nonheme iron enzyme [Blastocatellia bacterium]|nr:SUMF1/EgtB/PvdO family nonheme iron enzyme [Blastocatellia bacterium]